MVTTYGVLLDIAVADLTIAATRPATPGSGPTAHTPAAVLDVAAALAHLGATLGLTSDADIRVGPDRQRAQLLAALKAASAVSALRTAAAQSPTGVDLDLADAASALRTAADLIASRGPRPEDITARYLDHSEWTAPRPETLYTPHALAGAWSQIASLAQSASVIAHRTDLPELRTAGDRWARAATGIPVAPAVLALELTQPGWPLPLPHRDIPGEWDGRMQELTALAWRVGSITAPRIGPAHPIGALRGIAEIAHVIHVRAARSADDLRESQQLNGRAEVWRRISACTHCLHTPADTLTPERRWSLARTRELAHTLDLDSTDLLTGRTVAALAARHIASGLARNYEDHPAATIGPLVSASELRRHPDVAYAALHRRTTLIPEGSLAGLVNLYRVASQPDVSLPKTNEPSRPRVARRGTEASLSAAPLPKDPKAKIRIH